MITLVRGKDSTGKQVHLVQEVDSDDGRARYTATVPHSDYETFGDTPKQRDTFFFEIILYALGANKDNIGRASEDFDTISSRYIKQDAKPPLWSMGLKLTPDIESKLDKIIIDERYGILPTALCPVRILKQKKSPTPEDRIVQETEAMQINNAEQTKSS